jgi:hypothetical protein
MGALATALGVTSTEVMQRLAQVSGSNANRPGTTLISSEWIELAEEEIEDAATEGGLDFSAVASDNQLGAYWQLRNLLALRAALHHMISIGLPVFDADGAPNKSWLWTEKQLDLYRQGKRVGQITSSASPALATNYWGSTDTANDIDAGRFSWDDEL